ncbi:hypothetical protein ETD86_48290, partial [Nonomuraea turkmeniaca]
MEGDHRVWPPLPGARHRRTPPEDTEPAWGPRRAEEPRRKPHPLDLDAGESEDLDEPWNPRIRRTAERDPGHGYSDRDPDAPQERPAGSGPQRPTGAGPAAGRDDWRRGPERDEWGRGPEQDDWG